MLEAVVEPIFFELGHVISSPPSSCCEASSLRSISAIVGFGGLAQFAATPRLHPGLLFAGTAAL